MSERLRNLANAAEAGDAEAMTELALVFARGEERQRVDLAKAVDWYEKAAGAGSRRAMGNLAYLYLNGISVRRDPVRAVALYEAAVRGRPRVSISISTIWRDAASLALARGRTGRGRCGSTRRRRVSACAWRNGRWRGWERCRLPRKCACVSVVLGLS